MDNPRNEVSIELAGETRTMRASFAAIRNIERDLGNILPLIDKIGQGNVGVDQCATIIFYGLKGFDDHRLTKDAVGEAVMDRGLSAVMPAVVEFVTGTLKGVAVGKPQPEDKA
ncbi:GTA-gp10 family protein [Methylopila sp. 73B]|uniref:GTA-gp10 family protein n=1 Tax=Methylopila sp. 73B TaxID=1120792 RepID=UPI0018CC1579|nr:GTA-gp10 family protein [Methylopila sp. 73B]